MKKLIIGIIVGLMLGVVLANSSKLIAFCSSCIMCNGTGNTWQKCYTCNGQGGNYERCFYCKGNGEKCY